MKKTILSIFFISVCSFVSGQFNFTTQWPSRFRLGAEGGISMVSFFGNPTTEKSHINTLGYSGGIFFHYSFNQILHPDSTSKTSLHFGLKSGVYFDRKGAVTTPQSASNAGLPYDSATTKTNMEYITVPILVQFAMGREGRVKFYEGIGPFVSVLVDQNTIRRSPDGTSTSFNNINGFQKVDIGLALSFGIEIPIKQKFYFNVEFRQNIGLFNINAGAFPPGAIVQTNSSNLYFGFCYRFGRNKPFKEK